ncbi:MAG TPA: CoA transferase [Caulobacteraceae bacterium]|nr:CoA transferase [Caulobacteraceae bacterium]
MAYDLLKGLRVVEGASFIAAPSCGLHLLQMGAEVIRFDPIGGGPDFHRWPLSPGGMSLYWEGLNKGKKSIALDLGRPEGRELAQRLAAAPGEAGGVFVTNYPVEGFLSHARLAALRSDLISLRVMGWADGRTAVDYTVNAALGVPLMTGPAELPADQPVNHVLPAWDLMTGAYAAFVLMAAERCRRETRAGQEIRLPLADVALASLSHIGQVAEVLVGGADRPRYGNDLFGAFGRDFALADGERVMVAAITRRQWTGLLEALGLQEAVAALERDAGTSFAADEGERFRHRERLTPLVAAAMQARTLAQLAPLFETLGVCWAPYRTTLEALNDPAIVPPDTPLMATIDHPSGHTYPTAGPAASLEGLARDIPVAAPKLGQHTEEVLAEVLGLPAGEIARLHDAKLVASAA